MIKNEANQKAAGLYTLGCLLLAECEHGRSSKLEKVIFVCIMACTISLKHKVGFFVSQLNVVSRSGFQTNQSVTTILSRQRRMA